MKKLILALLLFPFVVRGQITTVAGTGLTGVSGDNGHAMSAAIDAPHELWPDAAGNVFIVDKTNHVIRKIDVYGIITTVAGNGTMTYSGDGTAATASGLQPISVTSDNAGNIYILDYTWIINGDEGTWLRKVNSAGIISTIAGNGTTVYSGDGGPATAASFYGANDIVADATGKLYVGENGRIRVIDLSGNINTVVSHYNYITSIALGGSGKIYFVQGSGNSYQSYVKMADGSGNVTAVAGNDISGYSEDGVPATATPMAGVTGIAVDAAGNVYLSDGRSRIRKINTAGIITTFAGNGTAGYSGDGGPATAAEINEPRDVAIDYMGNLLIADTKNNRIRKVTLNETAVPVMEQKGRVNIYPNPAQNELTITAEVPIGNVQIINMAGQVVFECKYKNSTITADVHTLRPGSYIVLADGTEVGKFNKLY